MTLVLKKRCTKCECTFHQDELWNYRLDDNGEDVLDEKCPKCGNEDFEFADTSHIFVGFPGPDGVGC